MFNSVIARSCYPICFTDKKVCYFISATVWFYFIAIVSYYPRPIRILLKYFYISQLFQAAFIKHFYVYSKTGNNTVITYFITVFRSVFNMF